MRKFEQDESWVIFQTMVKGEVVGPKAVCEQDEWDTMERLRPGLQWLVQSGLRSEGIAERLARGTTGDRKPRVSP